SARERARSQPRAARQRRDDAAVRTHHRRSQASGTARVRTWTHGRGTRRRVNNMVVVMEERATEPQIQAIVAQLTEMGFDVHRSTGATRTVIGAVGGGTGDPQLLEVQSGVHEVLRITEPYKLASRTFKPENSVIAIGEDVRVGGDEVIVMAGPCSAESEEQVERTAA